MVARDCDFIPAEYHERRRVRTMIRQRVGGCVGLVAIMLVWLGAHHYRLKSAEAMMADVGAQKAQMESLAARKAEMERARSVLTNLQDLMVELGGRRSLVAVFGELSRRIPDSIVLTGCQLYEPSLSDYAIDTDRSNGQDSAASRRNAAFNMGGQTSPRIVEPDSMRRGLTLYGVAWSIPDITDFAASLDKSPAFYEVDMDVRDPVVFAGQPVQQFRMTCRIAQQSENVR